MIRIEDIIFWILITSIVAIALWLLSGSPPQIDALIAITLFVVASEMLIWKKMFSMDKNFTIGFMKVKHNIEKINIEMNNSFNLVENKLNNIDNKLGKII